ncbi:hypothetical protein [Niveispirillum fermenti]|uniref:hypothetical protein n=1 Tax=Niveispirillum fermenti TaxID=1233113 RepID=UPI003A882675
MTAPPLAAHGLTLTITPANGQGKGMAARLLDRLARMADAMGVNVADTAHLPDGRARAVVSFADAAPRRTIAPPLDPLPLLAAILYRPAPADLRPAGMADGAEITPAAMLWRAGMTGQPLPLDWALHGMASQHGPDPMALSLCPLLLARHRMLPDNVTAQAAQTILSLLLGAGHGQVRVRDGGTLDTILIPAQLVRALVSTDGTLPPHPPAISAVA